MTSFFGSAKAVDLLLVDLCSECGGNVARMIEMV